MPNTGDIREWRNRVVRLHMNAIKIMQFAAMTGLSYLTVRLWIGPFETGGSLINYPTLKQASVKRVPVKARVKLREDMADQLTMLERYSGLVIGQFHVRRVFYAA